MKLNTFILPALAASTVSAIDIYIHEARGCGGGYSLCERVPPNICCGVVANYQSVAFRGIPREWNLNVRSHWGGTCVNYQEGRNVFGEVWACLSGGPNFGVVTGGGYSFNGKKRDVLGLEAPEQCTTGNKCEGFQRPNKAVFTDGTEYNLTLLDEAGADEILAIIATGGTSAEVDVAHRVARI